MVGGRLVGRSLEENFVNGASFLRVTSRCTSSVGFEVLTSVSFFGGIKASPCVSVVDKCCLHRGARHGDTGRLAILIHARFADDALDVVSVSEGCGQSLQDNSGNTLASSVAIRGGIPHS